MATSTNKLSLLLALLLFLYVLSVYVSPALADTPPSTPVSPYTLCKFTPDPSYCKSVLPPGSGNVYDYGRFSVRKSLTQARKFLGVIDRYLANSAKLELTLPAIRALQDCRLLASLILDYLLSSLNAVNAASQILPIAQADDVQTLLSAILTNQQTCLDGIQATASAWSVKNGITAPLSNDTKLCSVSLALFTKGWVPKKKKLIKWEPKGLFKNGKLSLQMSDKTRAFYESVAKRNLLQVEDSNLLVSDMVTVSKYGNGNFTTINDALAVAPNNTDGSNGYFLIYVTTGVYEEYVSIPKNKKYLLMIGDVITGNRSVADGWTTFNSATFAVVAPNFVAVNITIRNTAGAIKNQAVALRSGADLSVFYSCSFEAYQDTLYTHSLRQFYKECDIYGTVDFIFGNAAVVFQNCNLYPRQPLSGQFNAITAQGRTDPNQNTGTSIHNCTIRAADDLAKSKYTVQTYLGRPWKEYSRTVYMQTYMDSLINPAGWHEWNGDFALNTSYYAEYNNTGPGSNTENRVKWPGYHIINTTDAASFTVLNFLVGDNWIRQTGVPYSGSFV